MPEPTTPATAGGTPDSGPTAGQPDKTFTQAEIDKIVADRLTRERAKYADYEDLKASADRLKELEERDKSEAEKAAQRAEAAEKKLAEAESRALRLEIAHEKGLTPSQAKRLVGSSKEELEADADELLEAFKSTDDRSDSPSRRPKEKLRPGASSQEEPDVSPSKVADEILSKPY